MEPAKERMRLFRLIEHKLMRIELVFGERERGRAKCGGAGKNSIRLEI